MKLKTLFVTNLILFIAIILWASAFVGIRVGLHDYSPGSLALLRYLVASLVIAPLYFRYRSRDKEVKLFEILRIMLIGALGIGVYNVTLNYGEVHVTAATASFIINQAPVIIAFLAVLFLRERLSLYGWFGFLVSFAGIVVIAYSEHRSIQLQRDTFYIFIATIISAFYSIMQKPLLSKFNGIELTALIIWSGTLVMLFFVPNLACEIHLATWKSTLTVVYLGIFPGVISYTLWSIALAKMPAARIASYLYFLPLLTTLIGWLCISEMPAFLSLIGGVIALLGSFMVQFFGEKVTVE